jgi:uncharacterized YkwD family protein
MKKLFSIVIVLSFLFFPLHNFANLNDSGNKVAGIFTTTSVKKVQVTSSTLKLRTGAGTSHSIITTLTKGKVVDVLGKIGSWYVVKTSSDTVGCIYSSYVKPYTASAPTTTTPPTTANSANSTEMQNEMLGYINAERVKAGAAPLTLSQTLSNGAYLKSKDMGVNGYFDHNSPTYGSPFDMMKSLGITYTAAGENIAKNTSVKGAHDAFMNSPGHRANILNASFGKIGLGFYQSGGYLYVTQWFTN